jgi:hypothetical protein
MWVEDTDQQKLCKQTKLEVTDKLSTTTTTTTQTHKFFHRSPISSLVKLKENCASFLQ